MRVLFLALIGLLFMQTNGLYAQYNHQFVFPDLTEDALLDELVDAYKPGFVLSYSQAREKMYGEIYLRDDSVRCVYSGHAIELPPGVDPIQHLLKNGSPDGINTEHTYPQSKGAGNGPPRSDMHHLFPARANVNSQRSNAPFAEINDDFTDRWFYKTQELTSEPTQNKDLYSEADFFSFTFEPREDHKGNVARAVFYFYTMYKGEADSQDPIYFENMVEDLCQWHIDDPVDSLEWNRSQMIANYQDGKPNPFVLDCTLPQRSYCINFPIECNVTLSTEPLLSPAAIDLELFPNPAVESLTYRFALKQSGTLTTRILDALGRPQNEWEQDLGSGMQQEQLSIDALPAGTYFLQLHFQANYGPGFQTLLSFQIQ